MSIDPGRVRNSNAGWNTLLQPFYVLSIAVGSIIGLTIGIIVFRACLRRRFYRQRFARAIDGGWAIPVFSIPETPPLGNKKNVITQPQPVMMEARLDLWPATPSWREPRWDEALPLSMTVVPPTTTHNHNLILQLFRTHAFFTSGFRERIKTIQWLRSNQPNRPTEGKSGTTSHSRTNRTPRPSSVPQETVETVQAEVTFVIAMPMAPPPARFSSATAHEPLLEVAGQELCLGSISSTWQRPPENTAAAVPANQYRLSWQTEDVGDEDFASTIRTRPAGPARSIVSSRHLYVGDYGDEASSYAMRPSGSFVYSGSGYETQASQLAPPSEQQHDQRSTTNAHSLLSPPSRAFTPSQRSVELPTVPAYMIPHIQVTEPIDVEIASTPTDLPLTQDDHSSISSYGQELPRTQTTHEANTSTYLPSESASVLVTTDAEIGYDADADNERNQTLRPKKIVRKRIGS
ncbi:hypothetical protein CPB86DRAFT_781592 [Serendipita vermifera]|nr:hypothetical protein CPB86DRAFT_781592 [Serendipita vermifera]